MPLSIRQNPMPLGASSDSTDSAGCLAMKSAQGGESAFLTALVGQARGVEEGSPLWDPWGLRWREGCLLMLEKQASRYCPLA